MNDQHRHEWTPTDTPGIHACTQCPATATQCGTCTRILDTTGRTCDTCVSRARNDLRTIRDLYRALPDVIATVAGLHAMRYDRTGGGKTTADTTIIGGPAFVLAGPGNPADRGLQLGRHETTETIATLAAAERHDPPSVLAVLTGWEDAFRTELGMGAADRTTIDDAVRFLLEHTDWAAQTSDRWDEYRTDTRALLWRLKIVTGNDDRPVRSGVPCPYCGGNVVQHWTDKGLNEHRVCDQCCTTFPTEAHFLLAIRHAHQALPDTHPDQHVTLDDAARILRGHGVRPNTLAVWAHRDRRDAERYEAALAAGQDAAPPVPRLPAPTGKDERGRALYRLGDLADRARAATTGAAT